MKYIFYFILSTFLVCCKQKEEKKQTENYTSYSSRKVRWDLYFPDTVIVNRKYDGRIIYKGILDTLTTSFDDKHNRYIKVILTTSNKLNLDINTLKAIAKDTFGAINHREIPFYDIKFSKPGKNYIHGYIIDHAFTDTNSQDKLVRLIEKEVTVNCEVYVREK